AHSSSLSPSLPATPASAAGAAPGGHAAAAHGSVASSGPAVAYVAGTPILQSSYRHWLSVDSALGGVNNPSHSALAFLITSSWVLGEAAARHLSVSEEEAKSRLSKLEASTFGHGSGLSRFLAKSHETSSDLLARTRVELLESRVADQVTTGHTGQRTALLAGFENRFKAHWKALTDCLPAYVMEDCKQYKGAPEQLNPRRSASTSSSTAGGRSTGGRAGAGAGAGAGSSGSAPAASSSSGEVYSTPGAFSVGSSEFERNGAIPAQYTCDGHGGSPALEWSAVPKGASELFLFVIDMNSNGSGGGIRWVVGGISPSSHGVAAGQLPPGAIVGKNTAGVVGYSPICPDHGHTDTVEFVMYALKNKISLAPGFEPALAEHEYGSTKDLLGQAAVNYGVYHRP
ncbi:MAG: YbhB/YbcL family Raf kinase inhibitor-like protein, partial [Solirubrobacterales bacterium]|nr:YbhB/YbcL family Raf kinase inhibitor-like protein [Solirubrobacterales bacterium]